MIDKVDTSDKKVNHPSHYEGSTSLECIQAMEIAYGTEAVANFCLCNAFKYMWRYKNKNGRQDLEKAKWYLTYALGLNFPDASVKKYVTYQVNNASAVLTKLKIE